MTFAKHQASRRRQEHSQRLSKHSKRSRHPPRSRRTRKALKRGTQVFGKGVARASKSAFSKKGILGREGLVSQLTPGGVVKSLSGEGGFLGNLPLMIVLAIGGVAVITVTRALQ